MAQSGAFPDRASKEAERLVAAIFSSTMREYSAGEHFPHAIMRLRRPIVSHDAKAISIIITGREAGLRRVCLVISKRWPITTETASSDGARSSHAGGRCPTPRAPFDDCSSHEHSDFSLPPRYPRSISAPVRSDDGVQYETARHWGVVRHGHPQEFPRWVPLMLEMMDPAVSRKPPDKALVRPRLGDPGRDPGR